MKNSDDWKHICDPNFFQLETMEILKLVEKLEMEGFQVVGYKSGACGCAGFKAYGANSNKLKE